MKLMLDFCVCTQFGEEFGVFPGFTNRSEIRCCNPGSTVRSVLRCGSWLRRSEGTSVLSESGSSQRARVAIRCGGLQV